MRPILSILTLITLTGCVGGVIEPAVTAQAEPTPPSLTWSDWGLTLSRTVVQNRVDYRRILADPAPLERFLAMIARIGPESTPQQFPARDFALAYYINCYNATIVRSVCALAKEGKVPAQAPWGLESRFGFRVDGRVQTPADLRRRALDLAGDDWRVRFALCGGLRYGPPLHPRPFLGDLLDGQLDFATRMALYSPDVVATQVERTRKLLLWEGLFQIKDRLIADYETRHGTSNATILNVLGEWSNRRRREFLASAVGYIVDVLPPSDWINGVDAVPESTGGLLAF